MFDLAIMNGSVYLDHAFKKTNIYVTGEKIAKISRSIFPAKQIVDAENKHIIPGLIDPHTHMQLDLTTIHSCDDFSSGTKSALFGGVTTIIDFLAPSSNASELEQTYLSRLEEAKNAKCDYQFHATIKNPNGSLEAYVQKVKELGMSSIKLFTTYSNTNRRTYDPEIIELLKLSKKYQVLIMAHIENDDLIDLNSKYTFRDLPLSRPTFSETKEALKLASYVRETGGFLYMVHLSSGITLERLIQEYSDILNKNFFVESCPQYFTLTNDLYKQKDGYLYTLAPPLRHKDEKDLMISYFDQVFAIGTDHCPFMKSEKNHELLNEIPLGIGGIESSFHVMHHLFKDKVIDKMTVNPATVHQLIGQKGKISEGYDADLVLYHPSISQISTLHSKCDYSPYFGFSKDETITDVFLRGHHVIDKGQYHAVTGHYLKGRTS